MINQVIIEGRVTKTPEIQYSDDGKPYVRFAIANNRSYKQKEEWKEKTTFVDCVIFQEVLLEKGDRVLVIGVLEQQTWEKDGKKHSKHSIIAKTVRVLLGKKKEDGTDIDVEL